MIIQTTETILPVGFIPHGEQIKKLRISRDMNQETFATFLGVSQCYISRIERGSSKVSKKIKDELYNLFDFELS